MSDTESITFRLKAFNAWRRGNDAPQPCPKMIGEDIDTICDIAKRLERERDEAQERVKELVLENENLYRRLESVHEVYRLSSVCRELKAENEKLKALLEEKETLIERVITWPHDADPFTSPDHDNDRHYP